MSETMIINLRVDFEAEIESDAGGMSVRFPATIEALPDALDGLMRQIDIALFPWGEPGVVPEDEDGDYEMTDGTVLWRVYVHTDETSGDAVIYLDEAGTEEWHGMHWPDISDELDKKSTLFRRRWTSEVP